MGSQWLRRPVSAKCWGATESNDAQSVRRDAMGRSTCLDPQWFPVLEGISIYNYLFMSRSHVQGVASQAFDFSRNSSWASALSPKNRPKISISCRQPLNVGRLRHEVRDWGNI